jgi:hypothetical protein
MNLRTAQYLSRSKQVARPYNAEMGWKETHKGLGGVLLGYFVLLVGIFLGATLFSLGERGHWLSHWVQFKGDPRDLFYPLSVAMFSVTALVGTVVILRGEWLCLKHAPSVQNGKELIYLCVISVVGAVITGALGGSMSGARPLVALANGADVVDLIDIRYPGNILQLCCVVLAIFSTAIFTQYLGSVATSIQDQARAVGVERNLLFLGMLVGGTLGALVCGRQWTIVAWLVPWVIASWVFWFVWHVWLVVRVRQSIAKSLRQISGLRKPLRPVDDGTVATKTLSGLRRLANKEES